tara:strand:+ start:154 stop:1668 length:1515 start_codon:yes stop_codon:yes gene_type:complete
MIFLLFKKSLFYNIIMSIPNRLKSILFSNTNNRILSQKIDNSWNWVNRKDLTNKVNFCIDKLKDNNIQKNDRVLYKGKNSIEWVSWNMAALSLGAVWVPVYHNQNKSYSDYIINDCDPKLLITDSKYDSNVKQISNEIENLNYEIEYDCIDNELSTLIYTSGTTGSPKGVMLTHDNLLSNIDSIGRLFSDMDKGITSLNILPWAHIYGLTTELYYNLLNDNKVAICSGPEYFIKECREIQPNVLYLVPKVLESIKTKTSILDKPYINFILPFVLRKLFGGKLITIFMGGAKLDENTRLFYSKSNIKICEGYGCSETSPMISVNHLTFPRNEDSIGQLLDNLDVEIINDEIQISGPNVMRGYWNNEEATNNVLVERNNKIWYKTGDSGYLDDTRMLYYNGRISENYKMSNGKFVNVSDIESKIKKYFNNCFIVYGENKPYNIMITDTCVDNNTLKKINENMDNFLKIKSVLKLDSNTFTDYLTPKMSIKRKLLIKDFEDTINTFY